MKKRNFWIVASIVLLIIFLALYRWQWRKLSENIEITESYAFPPAEESSLTRIIGDLGPGAPGESGFFPINLSHEALIWRLALIDSAERSIDAQYYLWHRDKSGELLIDRLLKAADRGVRVRILIDDMTAKNDEEIAIVHEHPNFEIRIFNPTLRRRTMIGQAIEFVFNFGRLNHRMHNKLLVADNSVGIVGGRNIGDDYFGLSDDLNFRDFDLLTIGPVVPDVSSRFDLYWNSDLAFPLSSILSIETKPEDLPDLQTHISQRLQGIGVFTTEGWLTPKSWTDELLSLKDRLFWAEAKVIYDLPSLEDKKTTTLTQMAQELENVARETKEELLLSSAYFVPLEQGTNALRGARERGVHIRILTNSLAATDVVAVHSGYAPYRKDLLKAGIELYEFRPDAKDRSLHEHPSATAERFGLHTKCVIYDRKIVYVGSLNLDPRAKELNTEIGVLVNCPELAETIIQMFERDHLPENSWRLELDQNEKLVWHSDEEPTRREPAYCFWDRIVNVFFHILPIEGQL